MVTVTNYTVSYLLLLKIDSYKLSEILINSKLI